MTTAVSIRIFAPALLLVAVFGSSTPGRPQQQPASLTETLDLIKEVLTTHGVQWEQCGAGNGSTKLKRQSLHKIDHINIEGCKLTFTEAVYSGSKSGAERTNYVTIVDEVEIHIADIDPDSVATSKVNCSLIVGTGKNSSALYFVVMLNTIGRKDAIQVQRTIIGSGQHDVRQIKSDSREFIFGEGDAASRFARSLASASQGCKVVR